MLDDGKKRETKTQALTQEAEAEIWYSRVSSKTRGWTLTRGYWLHSVSAFQSTFYSALNLEQSRKGMLVENIFGN